MRLKEQGPVVWLVWATLVFAALWALWLQRWSTLFVSVATLAATMIPVFIAARMHIRLPVSLLTFAVLFVFSTLFLGEALDFYERYWWWDVVLHGTSAVGFGIVGFLAMYYLFGGDRYRAPALAVALFGWSFAVSIGAVWEIFEFAMDQIFGLNMQKSGLMDTMWDLIVDVIGGLFGAMAGYLYLKGAQRGPLSSVIAEFVHKNRRLFRRHRPPPGSEDP